MQFSILTSGGEAAADREAGETVGGLRRKARKPQLEN
jgi:hypothetical protein